MSNDEDECEVVPGDDCEVADNVDDKLENENGPNENGENEEREAP